MLPNRPGIVPRTGTPVPVKPAVPLPAAKPPAPEPPKDTSQIVKSEDDGYVRIGIVGEPGVGKTTAALTFPKPIYLDFDRNLPAGVDCVPFWNPAVCDKLAPRMGHIQLGPPPNVFGALTAWLSREGPRVDPGSTIIFDSWSTFQNMLDEQITHETNSQDAKDAKWTFYRYKKERSGTIMNGFKRLRCHVIIIFHEMPERDELERVVGIKALMTGAYKDEIAKDLPDFWRMRLFTKPTQVAGNVILQPGRYFQIRPDPMFTAKLDAKYNALIPANTSYIQADFRELVKFLPAKTTTETTAESSPVVAH